MKTDNFPKSEQMPDYVNERDVFGLIKSKKISMTGFKYLATNMLSPNLDVAYAGLGFRTLATLIDVIIIISLMLIPEIFFFSFNYSINDYNSFRIIVGTTFWIFYHATFDSSTMQATFGKRLLKLKIVDLNGNRISFFRATFRSLAVFISIVPIGLGIWYMTTDPKKRSWHDLISGTFVIKS
jgi:uncharacterized RDD family membrane protein YckC